MKSFIRKLSEIVDRIARWLAIFLTAGFTLLIFITVLLRYVFHISIILSVEFSKLLFVWACFMGATVTYKQMQHIRFEFSAKVLGKRGVRIGDKIFHFSSFTFFLLLLLKSIEFIRSIWGTYFPGIGLSQGWLYISLPVSVVIFIVHNINFIMDSFDKDSSLKNFDEIK